MVHAGGKHSAPQIVDFGNRDASGVHVSQRPLTRDEWLSVLSPDGVPLSEEVQSLLDTHLRLQRQYDELRANQTALVAAMDRVPLAVFVVSDGRVLASNRLCQSVLGNGVVIDDGVLTTQKDDQRSRLVTEMQLALRSGESRSLVIEYEGSDGLQTVVFPIGSDLPDAVAVVIADPNAVPQVAEDLYRGLFGLTPTEARVAAELVMGRAPREIAQVLEVGVETTRTHVKHILGKMGCHRQVDVVRKLVLSPALFG